MIVCNYGVRIYSPGLGRRELNVVYGLFEYVVYQVRRVIVNSMINFIFNKD